MKLYKNMKPTEFAEAIAGEPKQAQRTPQLLDFIKSRDARIAELTNALRDIVDYVSPGDDVPLAAMLEEARAALKRKT